MILRQFLHRDPVAISYLLGCVGHGAGAVVDPLFPIEPYLRAAEAERTPIRYVIDTHLHADHDSAGRALAEAVGAAYVLHESAGTEFAFQPVRDGETLLGSVLLGIGTAMVYPTLLAAVSDAAEPAWRARGLSVYRFWRDLGYAIGALAAGVLADLFGLVVPILAIGGLTFLSGIIVVIAGREDNQGGQIS